MLALMPLSSILAKVGVHQLDSWSLDVEDGNLQVCNLQHLLVCQVDGLLLWSRHADGKLPLFTPGDLAACMIIWLWSAIDHATISGAGSASH